MYMYIQECYPYIVEQTYRQSGKGTIHIVYCMWQTYSEVFRGAGHPAEQNPVGLHTQRYKFLLRFSNCSFFIEQPHQDIFFIPYLIIHIITESLSYLRFIKSFLLNAEEFNKLGRSMDVMCTLHVLQYSKSGRNARKHCKYSGN
jgi:hypothetical protein